MTEEFQIEEDALNTDYNSEDTDQEEELEEEPDYDLDEDNDFFFKQNNTYYDSERTYNERYELSNRGRH